MSLRPLPEIENFTMSVVNAFDISSDALEKWDASIVSSAKSDTVISVFGEIGYDGNTPKRIAAALRSIGDQNVTVEINSQGGNFFDGVAIYNMLRAHPHKVTVRVLGIAASAASVIAMAGDEVLVAKSGNIMIHNCSAIIIANRHELVDVIANMEKFDAAMAAVYAERCDLDAKQLAAMMDAETYIPGPEAVEMGLADAFLPADQIARSSEGGQQAQAIARVDAVLARQNIPRSERRTLLAEVKGSMPNAAPVVTPNADQIMTGLTGLIATIQK